MDKNDEIDITPDSSYDLRKRFQHAGYLDVNGAGFFPAWFKGGSRDISRSNPLLLNGYSTFDSVTEK